MDWLGWTNSIARMTVGLATLCIGMVPVAGAELRHEPNPRVLHDTAVGKSWIVERDPVHPGGPGRMVQQNAAVDERTNTAQHTIEPVVIHAGDRVVFEEDTAVVHAELEAVALGNAVTKHLLPVRIVIGGRIALAIAIEPGRVRLSGGRAR